MSAASETPVVCFDLDGVIWRGDDAIPGSAHAVDELRGAGLRVAFLSNNSSQPVSAVIEKLAGVGVAAETSEVLTSALSAAALLAAELPDADVL
ncbi:MAG TPA: hypothetical protein VGU73_11575, partial [Acidimicrobiia bacterium]|nr:hypothetical protein [Acidimicrobiia bacterium]